MARLHFEVNFRLAGQDRARDEERPFRILVLGDFTGRRDRAPGTDTTDLSARKPVGVDVDSFDAVLRRFAPRPHVRISGGELDIAIGKLDDLHPDSLYDRLEAFAALRERRARLLDPATSEATVREMLAVAPTRDSSSGASAATEAAETGEEIDDMFERLLGRPAAERSEPQRGNLDELLQRLVAPHIVPAPSPHLDVLVESIDSAIAALMSGLLHDPAFQRTEAAWRGVHWLLHYLETDAELSVHLFDASKLELAVDLAAADGDLRRTALHETLVAKDAELPGSPGWSLVVGLYPFGTAASELTLLAALGSIARAAGAPFLAQAAPSLVGASSFHTQPDVARWQVDAEAAGRWQALRTSEVATSIGLAAPRFLLRLPYGERLDEIESFPFAELGVDRVHEHYLWGNPALLCAMLVARAIARGEDPGADLQVDDLPAHSYHAEGEVHLQACAEAYLPERTALAMLERGVMPLLSMMHQNAVRLLRFQSVSHPPQELSFR